MAYQSRHTGQEIDDGIDSIPEKTSDLQNDSNFISSTVVTAFVVLTQAEYDALTNKNSTTLYLVPKE